MKHVSLKKNNKNKKNKKIKKNKRNKKIKRNKKNIQNNSLEDKIEIYESDKCNHNGVSKCDINNLEVSVETNKPKSKSYNYNSNNNSSHIQMSNNERNNSKGKSTRIENTIIRFDPFVDKKKKN